MKISQVQSSPIFWIFICLLSSIDLCIAQLTARMTAGGNGYLEKLPPDYATNPTRKYPVLFFLHGTGEVGNGSPTDLNKLKVNGIPKIIEGRHTMCFTVNGIQECFIVISPQLRPGLGGWWPSLLNDVFDYVLNGARNYRIDKNRVYLTGLSLGGQGVYIGVGDSAVPDIFAAGAPVSGFGNGNGCRISSRKIPMWGFHGTSDGTIFYGTGLSEFNNIGNCTSPTPTAELKWTPYSGLGHNIWENYAYRTDNNLHTPNLYQWLLTKSKNSLPTLVVNNPAPVCSPATVDLTGSNITVGSTVGMTFSYWSDAGATSALANPSAVNSGTYYIRGTLGAINDVKPVIVVVNANPNILVANPPPVCSTSTTNISASSVTAGSSAGLTFTYWSNNLATIPYTTPVTAPAGTYYIKGTAATGCFSIKPVVVTNNPPPVLVISNPSPVCSGVTSDLTMNSITTGSTTGLTFSYWTNLSATISLLNPSTASAGTYYIKGTNSFGCSAIEAVTISQNASPTLTITNPNAVCSPNTVDISASAITVGSSPGLILSYWLDSTASIGMTHPTSASTGTYYIKATNVAACSSIQPVNVIVTNLPTLSINPPAPACSPGTIDITLPSITNGSSPNLSFTYWTNPTTTIPLATPTTAPAGTYYIKGTAATGCFSIKPVVVTNNPLPVLVISNPSPVCLGVTSDLTMNSITTGSTTGLTFSYWTNLSATTPLLNPSTASVGTYYVKGTNSFGCAAIAAVTISQNASPTLTITNPNPVCSPNTVDITASAITVGSSPGLILSYWLDSTASISMSNPTSASTGTYYIKATNVAACSSIQPVNVVITNLPTLTINPPAPVCSPGTIDITLPSITSGSSPNLSFTYWTNPTATTPLATPTTAPTGSFYIKATNAFGCSIIKPVSVSVNPLPSVITTNPAAVCAPGSIDLANTSLTAGSSLGLSFTYWTNSIATQSLANPANVSISGTYFVKGTDANGCDQVAPIVAIINPQPIISITSLNSQICHGSTTNIQLSTSNNVPASFSWLPSVLTGNINGFASGTGSEIAQTLTTDNLRGSVRYFIQTSALVTKCAGFAVNVDVIVNPTPVATINTNASSAVICNGCTTNIVIQNSNNVAGTTFSWTAVPLVGTVNGQSNGNGSTIGQSLTKSTPNGSVRYTITPKSGLCEDNAITFDVKINNPPIANAGGNKSITLPVNSTILNGFATDSDGSIASYAWSKLAGPASFTITGDASPTATIGNMIAGTYQFRLLVQDNDGSIGINTMTLVVNPKINTPPNVSAGSDVAIQLPLNKVTLQGNANDTDGTIRATSWSQVNGRTANFVTSGNSLAASDLLQGEYTFRFSATDNNDATQHSDVTVTVLPDNTQFNFIRKKYITPNGDNENDKWVLDPDITRYESCKLTILSNAGEKIFETIGYLNDWDGTQAGRALPPDVYYYLCDCKQKKETGTITIIR
jgi:gliding motility-associated-like protein